MGVAAERSGDMQGGERSLATARYTRAFWPRPFLPATMYYKKAVQLEPDIESHVTSGDHHDTGEGDFRQVYMKMGCSW